MLQYLGEFARVQVGVAGESWMQLKPTEVCDPVIISTLDRVMLRSEINFNLGGDEEELLGPRGGLDH